MSKKFPRDNSEVKSFKTLAPMSQVLKKPEPKKEEVVVRVEATPDDINFNPFDDTLRVSNAVLEALSEASEVGNSTSSETSLTPPHQHPLVEKKYPIPLATGACVVPNDRGLLTLQFPADFLQYLGSHPSWEFVKGDSTSSLWSYDGGEEFLILSMTKGEGVPAIKHYLSLLARCECRAKGSVFLDLQLVPSLF